MTALSPSARSRPEPRIVHLATGRCLQAQLPADTLLVAAEGSLRVEIAGSSSPWLGAVMPAWLDGAGGAHALRLAEGECHRLEEAAWVSLSAAGDGPAACAVVEPAAQAGMRETVARAFGLAWQRARRLARA